MQITSENLHMSQPENILVTKTDTTLETARNDNPQCDMLETVVNQVGVNLGSDIVIHNNHDSKNVPGALTSPNHFDTDETATASEGEHGSLLTPGQRSQITAFTTTDDTMLCEIAANMEIESTLVASPLISDQDWDQSQIQDHNQNDGFGTMDDDKRNKRAIGSSSEEEIIPDNNRWSMLSNITNFLADSFENKSGSRAAKQQRREKD